MFSFIKRLLFNQQKDNEEIDGEKVQSEEDLQNNSIQNSDSLSTLYLVEESVLDLDDEPFIPQSCLLQSGSLISKQVSSSSSDDEDQKIVITHGHLSLDNYEENHNQDINDNNKKIEDDKFQNQSTTFFEYDPSIIGVIPKHQGYIQFTQTINSNKTNNSFSNNKTVISEKTNDTIISKLFVTPSNNKNMLSPDSRSKSVKFGPKKPPSKDLDIGSLSVPRKPILRKQSSSSNDSSRNSKSQILASNYAFLDNSPTFPSKHNLSQQKNKIFMNSSENKGNDIKKTDETVQKESYSKIDLINNGNSDDNDDIVLDEDKFRQINMNFDEEEDTCQIVNFSNIKI